MAKLTKAQYEFFEAFARNDLSNTLFPILASQGLEFTEELGEELLNLIDLKAYTEIVGAAFLERVDFTAVKRVDKVMKSDEFNSVIVASHQVSDLVHAEKIRILAEMLPPEEEATAE